MGVSTDAMLVFGIDLGEELPSQWEDIEGFDFYDHYPNWDKLPVELVVHCSDTYPMYILAIKELSIVAKRGFAEPISPDQILVSPDQQEQLRRWCQEEGIQWQHPRWFLCSYWG